MSYLREGLQRTHPQAGAIPENGNQFLASKSAQLDLITVIDAAASDDR
jgi:hypothetical protein